MAVAEQHNASRLEAFLHGIYGRRPDVDAALTQTTIVTDHALRIAECACCPISWPAHLAECLSVNDNRLVLARAEFPDPLQRAVERALTSYDTTVSFRLKTRDESVWLLGTVHAQRFDSKPLLVFTFAQPHQHQHLPAPDALMAWFELSRSEANLAIDLAQGWDVATIAERRCLSALTVRTHLRAVFEKTNTHKQKDLVALLVRLAAL